MSVYILNETNLKDIIKDKENELKKISAKIDQMDRSRESNLEELSHFKNSEDQLKNYNAHIINDNYLNAVKEERLLTQEINEFKNLLTIDGVQKLRLHIESLIRELENDYHALVQRDDALLAIYQNNNYQGRPELLNSMKEIDKVLKEYNKQLEELDIYEQNLKGMGKQ